MRRCSFPVNALDDYFFSVGSKPSRFDKNTFFTPCHPLAGSFFCISTSSLFILFLPPPYYLLLSMSANPIHPTRKKKTAPRKGNRPWAWFSLRSAGWPRGGLLGVGVVVAAAGRITAAGAGTRAAARRRCCIHALPVDLRGGEGGDKGLIEKIHSLVQKEYIFLHERYTLFEGKIYSFLRFIRFLVPGFRGNDT